MENKQRASGAEPEPHSGNAALCSCTRSYKREQEAGDTANVSALNYDPFRIKSHKINMECV